jgi:glycosyltransferase involved in cell wall biosynthesis
MDKSKTNILVAGLTRDSYKTLEAEINKISLALQGFKEVHWLIIESDSSDQTLSILEKLKHTKKNFEYAALGNLTHEYPIRSPRVAFCRNYYIREINNNSKYSNIDYVVMADLDGLNTEITQSGIDSCWERHDWDVCTANQDGPYYDIWALRHEYICPNDSWKEYNFYKTTLKLDEYNSLDKSIAKRMIKIESKLDWIEVDSAFGGLAIYKKDILQNCSYEGTYKDGTPICEHVPFHQQLKKRGHRIFINPRLINAKSTEHTKILRPHKKMLRFILNFFNLRR